MSDKWDIVIEPKRGLFEISFKELWKYRDLLTSLVKRDVVTVYKQTVLGPIWFIIQPIMTMLMFVLVFGEIAELPTDTLPQPLFYLCGIIIWNYFSECFNQTSDTFGANQDMFGKVYFPRLIVPFSKVVSGLIKFGIQFCLFIAVFIYFIIRGFEIQIDESIVLFPLFVILMASYGLGFGLLFSSLTTKYKDLKFLIQFAVQLVMYASIIVPFSEVEEGWKKDLLFLNPILHVVEGFRYVFLGKGVLTLEGMFYSVGLAVVVLFFGILVFNKTERNFIDTV